MAGAKLSEFQLELFGLRKVQQHGLRFCVCLRLWAAGSVRAASVCRLLAASGPDSSSSWVTESTADKEKRLRVSHVGCSEYAKHS